LHDDRPRRTSRLKEIDSTETFFKMMYSMLRAKWETLSPGRILSVCMPLALMGILSAEPEKAETTPTVEKPDIKMSETGEELSLPGLKIQVKEHYVDVDSKVCLSEGFLELIACAKDTKEHESIIAVQAKAAHIHAALLLLRAQPGNPAMRKPIEGQEGRWVDLPPRGSKVDVFLVVEDENGKPVERPISDFIMKGDEGYGPEFEAREKGAKIPFPTHTFLFAGSHVYKQGEGPPVYLADVDGNVISISTFGDELLCLPDVLGHGNEGLVWAVDSTHLPEIGTKVLLRLRPQQSDAAPAEKKD